MATRYTGIQILMETLLEEDVSYVFGNPGTTELPLIDALADFPQLEYILALHEAVAVSMADAYAQSTGRVGVVNLHVGPGLGNGLGSIYNAWEGHTPMVVTAGQQDSRMRLREPLLGHDLVAMAAPLTKWSVEANEADELAHLLNRAFKIARDDPPGPVFVSLPINVMSQTTEQGPRSRSRVYRRARPDADGIAQAAALLLGAQHPLIVCGDQVAQSGAVSALVALAEFLGAGVYSEILPARVNFPNQHPHYRDRLPHDQRLIRRSMGDSDVVLLVGGDFFEEVWFTAEEPFATGTKLIQVDRTLDKLGRNYTVHCALAADPRVTLETLLEAVAAEADTPFHRAAQTRRERLTEQKATEREQQKARALEPGANRAMSAARLMLELDEALPPDATIAAEAITATPDLTRTLSFSGPEDYLSSRGGGIGQGLPSAIGVKLAFPQRPVLCVSGDGSALYTIQALWTAAHHRIAVVFLVINNATYRILKMNMNRYRGEQRIDAARGYPHLDLVDPELDFVSLAEGFGVKARAIRAPEDVQPAVRAAFASGEPWLLDVSVDASL